MIIQSHVHKEFFDIPPGGHEIICIAGTNVTVPGMVVMLYAIQGAAGEGIRNAIPFLLFPHSIVLEIGADNIHKPLEHEYLLTMDEGDGLIMRKLN